MCLLHDMTGFSGHVLSTFILLKVELTFWGKRALPGMANAGCQREYIRNQLKTHAAGNPHQGLSPSEILKKEEPL